MAIRVVIALLEMLILNYHIQKSYHQISEIKTTQRIEELYFNNF